MDNTRSLVCMHTPGCLLGCRGPARRGALRGHRRPNRSPGPSRPGTLAGHRGPSGRARGAGDLCRGAHPGAGELHDRGGVSPVNPGRVSLEWEPAEEQQEAFHRAYYTCSAQYPIAGEFQPYDGEQLGAVYDHWVEETIPCLAALGYETSGMPSREAFIGGVVWDPRESTYQDVMRDVSNGRWIDEEDVYTTQCPTNPDW